MGTVPASVPERSSGSDSSQVPVAPSDPGKAAPTGPFSDSGSVLAKFRRAPAFQNFKNQEGF